jgi:formylglycine-generating enzyme required for sulfatase activity
MPRVRTGVASIGAVASVGGSMRGLPRAVLIAAFLAACSREPPTPAPIEEGPSAADSWATLTSLARWDTATPSARHVAAEEVARRMADFTLLRMATFSCGGQTHEVAIFRHAPTEMEFALVPGSADGAGPAAASASGPFLIARTETTEAAWRAVGGEPPKRPLGDDHPIVEATWSDAAAFCQRAGLRVPTRSQWERACRAGTIGDFCCGDDASKLADYAWFDPAAGHRTHAVGGKLPNAFGLHDMAGNVEEWCTDDEYDKRGPCDVPPWRCGGSWSDPAKVCRSGRASPASYPEHRPTIGFRAAKTVPDFR